MQGAVVSGQALGVAVGFRGSVGVRGEAGELQEDPASS